MESYNSLRDVIVLLFLLSPELRFWKALAQAESKIHSLWISSLVGKERPECATRPLLVRSVELSFTDTGMILIERIRELLRSYAEYRFFYYGYRFNLMELEANSTTDPA